MIVSHLSKKYHTYCEDRCAVSNRVFAVIDGATSLNTPADVYKKTAASRLAEYVKKSVLSNKEAFDTNFFRSVSKRIYEEGNILDCSAGIAGAAIDGEILHLFSIGDCEVIYLLKDGSSFRFKRTDLDPFDAYATEQMVRLAQEKGISVKQSRAYINDILVSNRAKKNIPGGYQIFESMKTPNFTMQIKDIPLKDVSCFYVCSDGFAQCFTTLGIFSSYKDLFTTSLTIEEIYNKIREVSFSDPDFNAFPRFKIIDDITVIKVEL